MRKDYKAQESVYLRSPNRAHHKPYIDAIAEFHDRWEIMESIKVRYAHREQRERIGGKNPGNQLISRKTGEI